MTKVSTQSSSQETQLPPISEKVLKEKGQEKGKQTQGKQSQGTSSNDPNNWISGNSNAWKLALGLLMQQFAKLAQLENKLNKELHTARAEITKEQAESARDQASASIMTGAAESGASLLSAVGSAYHGMAGMKSAGSKKMIHNEANKKLTDLHTEYSTSKLTTQMGNATPKTMTEAEFKSKQKQIHADRESKISEHAESDKNRESMVFGHRALADMGKSFGTSYGQAASTVAQSTGQLDQQMVQDVKEAEQSAQGIAQKATTEVNIGTVEVAAVRG